MANRHYLCKSKGRSIDQIVLRYPKVRVLWQLFFSLLGIIWVVPSSVRETLLSWHGAPLSEENTSMQSRPFVHFLGQFGSTKERLKTEQLVQMYKSSFIRSLSL